MASLRKPKLCACGGKNFQHLFQPERWVCSHCDVVAAVRAQRIAGICRKCGATEDTKKFKKGKNLCLDCFNIYMQEWRLKNPDWDSDPDFRRRRFESVQRSIQKSPEAFIKHLWYRLTRPSRKVGMRDSMHVNPKRLAILNRIEISLEWLLVRYGEQRGLCAVSGLPMVSKINDLCSISVDRIDPTLGYVPGNVQLVCKWVNLAKQRHSNEEFRAVLGKLRGFAGRNDG